MIVYFTDYLCHCPLVEYDIVGCMQHQEKHTLHLGLSLIKLIQPHYSEIIM